MNQINKNRSIIFTVLVATVFFVVIFLFSGEKKYGTISSLENSSLNVYTNNFYNFKIEFPKSWRAYEDFEDGNVIINIYKPQLGKNPPFDHFSDVDAILIYPEGFTTEVLVGQKEESILNMKEGLAIDEKYDYVLEGGDSFATEIVFSKYSKKWNSWGSIWSVSRIFDSDYFCNDNGQRISLEDCRPFDGHVFVRSGSTNQEVLNVQKEILKSFEFIK